MSKRLVFDFGKRVLISPPLYSKKLNIQPGDLSLFAPYGNGVYGYQERAGSNPIASAPIQEPSGGVVYFGSDITKADFEALLRLLEVRVNDKDFAVFLAKAEQSEERYIHQVRVVSRFGLRHLFGAISDKEYDEFPEQLMTVGGLLWSFIVAEQKRWGTSFMEDKGLGGKFGGDGHFACEELAFGFLMENEYYQVYRIWSRAWLVTK